MLPATLAVIIVLMLTTHPRHDTKAYADEPGSAVPYLRLSSEEDFPFLKFGDIPSAEHLHPPLYKAYRRAIDKFPDVQSCLVTSERTKERPNLLMFDWDRMHSFEEGEVCLFRMFSSIGYVNGVKLWLSYQGFAVTDHYEAAVYPDAKPTYAAQKWYTVVASWSVGEKGTMFYRNTMEKWARELFEHGISVGVTVVESGDVVDVNVVANTL